MSTVPDSTYLTLQRLQPRSASLFPYKCPSQTTLLRLYDNGLMHILPYDWDKLDLESPRLGTMLGGMWYMRDRHWSMVYMVPRNIGRREGPREGRESHLDVYCCGVVHFGPLAMGPPQFLHGGNSAAALDTLCGVFLNGIVENFASFDEGEIDPSKWTIGGNRTVKFDLTYRAGVKLNTTYGYNMGLVRKEGRKCFIRGGFFEVDTDSTTLDQWSDFDLIELPKGDKRKRKYAVEVDGLFIDAQDKYGKAGTLEGVGMPKI